MKLHITNNRVGQILRDAKSKAKGIQQRVLHEDITGNL
jgi:hypothetical protein